MTYGLSKTQRAIMRSLMSNGYLNRAQIYRVIEKSRYRRGLKPLKTPKLFEYNNHLREMRGIPVLTIPQVSSVHRTMKSLEDRGFVARLLNKRPAWWFRMPDVINKNSWVFDSDSDRWLENFRKKYGFVRLRYKGMIITYSRSSSTGAWSITGIAEK